MNPERVTYNWERKNGSKGKSWRVGNSKLALFLPLRQAHAVHRYGPDLNGRWVIFEFIEVISKLNSKHKVGISIKGGKEYRVILCGLDAAGKTTAMYKMRIMREPFIPMICKRGRNTFSP